MDIKDILINTFTNNNGLQSMKLVHIPTGVAVCFKGKILSYYKTKEKLLRELIEIVDINSKLTGGEK